MHPKERQKQCRWIAHIPGTSSSCQRERTRGMPPLRPARPRRLRTPRMRPRIGFAPKTKSKSDKTCELGGLFPGVHRVNIEVPTSSRIGQELARVRIGGDDGKQRVDATKHPQATGPTSMGRPPQTNEEVGQAHQIVRRMPARLVPLNGCISKQQVRPWLSDPRSKDCEPENAPTLPTRRANRIGVARQTKCVGAR